MALRAALDRNYSSCALNTACPPFEHRPQDDEMVLLFATEGNFYGGSIQDYLNAKGPRCIYVFQSARDAWHIKDNHPGLLSTAEQNGIALLKMPEKVSASCFFEQFSLLSVLQRSSTELLAEPFKRTCHGDRMACEQLSKSLDRNDIERFECILFNFSESNANPETDPLNSKMYSALKSEIREGRLFPHAPFVFTEEHDLVAIVPFASNSTRKQIEDAITEAVIKLEKKFDGRQLYVSVGAYSTSPSSLEHSYSTALETLRTSLVFDNKSVLRFYSDWRTHINIVNTSIEFQLIAAKEVFGDLLHDKKLLATLYFYLHCSESLTQTALRLDIHINTVKNRIAKIEECLSCDLKDENVRFALRMDLISLVYLRHIGKIEL